MKAGRLRYRVLIERPIRSVDTYGAPTKVWETVAEVPADISYVSGREFTAGERDLAEATMRVYVRIDPTIALDPSMRLTNVDNLAEFDIVAVLPDRTDTMATLVCKSGSRNS